MFHTVKVAVDQDFNLIFSLNKYETTVLQHMKRQPTKEVTRDMCHTFQGCTVIGYAGSEKKVAWLKELGFDHAFNYKTQDIDETLKQAAPGGVDCFYDNVIIAF